MDDSILKIVGAGITLLLGAGASLFGKRALDRRKPNGHVGRLYGITDDHERRIQILESFREEHVQRTNNRVLELQREFRQTINASEDEMARRIEELDARLDQRHRRNRPST